MDAEPPDPRFLSSFFLSPPRPPLPLRVIFQGRAGRGRIYHRLDAALRTHELLREPSSESTEASEGLPHAPRALGVFPREQQG